jgi:hypothetical protein
MDTADLLSNLGRHRGSFPEGLIAEAITRREEVSPKLLAILEDINHHPEPWLADQRRMVHIYAMYLLVLFREPRAYPWLV